MKIDEIMDVIRSLAKGQGFYSRLLSHIESLPEDEHQLFVRHIEGKQFKDSVDLVLFFEQ